MEDQAAEAGTGPTRTSVSLWSYVHAVKAHFVREGGGGDRTPSQRTEPQIRTNADDLRLWRGYYLRYNALAEELAGTAGTRDVAEASTAATQEEEEGGAVTTRAKEPERGWFSSLVF